MYEFIQLSFIEQGWKGNYWRCHHSKLQGRNKQCSVRDNETIMTVGVAIDRDMKLVF